MPNRTRAGAPQTSRRTCHWAQGGGLLGRYHDEEWGVPVHDDRVVFEFLILEGAQAGLSWETVLRKRQRYREVLDDFDASKIARYDARKVRALLADPRIIRNRLKISSTISNARAFLEVQREFGSFDAYIWRFTGGKTPRGAGRQKPRDVPARTAESDAMSKDLKKRGFRFVGSTICYAFMQATGMVNDHLRSCFRWAEVR
ncbi:MAG TPA: DNA-3-methyladenine glycosylase I [Candidatus Acidoferrales bacterium]|nr:DNA-3-methyladenine glycosylase I [Candidatus Acidoferrales bacterium]